MHEMNYSEGGSTCLAHYDLDIKKKKGLTILSPSEWAHVHKENIVEADNIYIITGWLNFPLD